MLADGDCVRLDCKKKFSHTAYGIVVNNSQDIMCYFSRPNCQSACFVGAATGKDHSMFAVEKITQEEYNAELAIRAIKGTI